MDKNFAQILSEKLKKSANSAMNNLETDSYFTSLTQPFSTLDPSAVGALLGKISPSQFHKKSSYPRTSPPRPREMARPLSRPEKLPTPNKPRPKHKLTALQQICQCYFKAHAGLCDDFFESELKAAFHSLAKKLHPDKGGNVEQFRELKTNYDELRTVFTGCS